MKRTTLSYTTEAEWLSYRTKDLTSTDIPALFGLSPYHTQRTLWESKKHPDATPIEPSKRMKAGQKLEKAIAELLAEENGWNITPFKSYKRIDDLRLGSSFDYSILDTVSDKSKILEIKNVGGELRKTWVNKDNELSAPFHIELQVQHQMLVSGINEAVIGVMFGGNDYQFIERKANPQIHELILKRAREFWESIDNNTPPAWDFENKIDQEMIKEIYSKPTDGKKIELGADIAALAEKYIEAKKEAAFLEEQSKALRAQILTAIGDAEFAEGNGYKISAKIQKKDSYIVKAQETRVIKVTSTAE